MTNQRQRSPIEMMVDQACGFDPSKHRMILLKCPACGKSKTVERDDTDPEDAEAVVFSCPACWFDPKTDQPIWLDKNEKQIKP